MRSTSVMIPAAQAAGSQRSSGPEVPPEMAAWVSAGRAALAVADRADGWDAATRRAALGELDRIAAMAVSARAKIVTAERDAGTWSLRGDRDLAGFLGRESRQGRGAGFAAVGQAETLAAMPAVAEALVDGPVTPRHLDELARASAASPRLAERFGTPEGQAQVVELARRFDGSEFGRQLKVMSASVDPATRQRQHDEQRANRFLNVSHTSGGALVKGLLDSVAGYKLQKVLDAFSPRPAADDERSREQRQADALMVAVDRALADRRTTPGAHAPVDAIVTISEGTWTALRASASGVDLGAVNGAGAVTGGTGIAFDGARAVTVGAGMAGDVREAPGVGSAVDVAARLREAPPVVDEAGRAWPASEVARMLCDCALTRAVVGAFGEVLDLGRGERLFQPQHWRALFAMGIRTCAIPGCGMPLRYTELHHIAWWDRDGGQTTLANCAAYCSFHHHEIHRLDIRITRLADGTLEHRHPDGRRYGGAPPARPEVARPTAAPPTRPELARPTAAPDDPHPPGVAARRQPRTMEERRLSDRARLPGGGEPLTDDRGAHPPDDLLSLLPA